VLFTGVRVLRDLGSGETDRRPRGPRARKGSDGQPLGPSDVQAVIRTLGFLFCGYIRWWLGKLGM